MRIASTLALFSLFSGAVVLVRCGGDDSVNIPTPDASDDTSMLGPDTAPACTGKTVCAGQCVDTTSDPKNCGSCGTACNGKDACQNSKCISCDKVDQDNDGYSLCVDCNDTDPNVNPGAFDVPGSGKDWDCDGVDDTAVTCETTADGGTIASDTADPLDFAHAMEMCDPWLTAAEFTVVADPRAHQVAPDWGLFKPQAGAVFAALSNGVAADVNDTKPAFIPNETPQLGTNFNTGPTAYPLTAGTTKCNLLGDGGPTTINDPTNVNDLTQLKVTLKVPSNAHSFSIDLNYLTTDSPEYNCTFYDDQALVLLDSAAFKGNVLYDSAGQKMTVNNEYLTLVTAGALTGTGMDQPAGSAIMGGGTGWLTMKAPVVPKETITLRFIIFDVQDHIYDSQFLADHFRWSTDTLGCGPTTTHVDGTIADGGAAPSCGEAGTD